MTFEVQVVGSSQALDFGFLRLKTCWDHVDVWESDCVDCVGGGIGLSNSFSSVLPFSFPTS